MRNTTFLKLMQGVWTALCFMIGFWAIQWALLFLCIFGNMLLCLMRGEPMGAMGEVNAGMQVFVTIASTIILALIFSFSGALRLSDLRFKGLSLKQWALLIVVLVAMSQGFSILTEFLKLPDLIEEIVQEILDMPLGVLAIAIIGPIGEELAFRSGIIGKLKRMGWRDASAIWVSAIAFGVVHLNPTQIFYATILGLFLGWVYVRTRSVIPCMVLHIVNNSVSVIGSYCMDDPTISAAEYYGTIGAVVVMICCLVLFGGLFWYFLKPQIKAMEPSDVAIPFMKE